MIQTRPYQEESLARILAYFEAKSGNPLIAYPTGCHAKGTEVLMFNGSVKKVEDIIIGDFLMGPDSAPRRVLSLVSGRQEMALINPTKGESFIVNKGHILSLKTTKHDKFSKGLIENISIYIYYNQSAWYKHTRKLWRVGVDFTNNDILPLSPYFMGIYLGDGGYSHFTVALTSQDQAILDYFINEITWKGDKYRISNNGSKASTVNVRRHIRNSQKSNTGRILNELGLYQKNSEYKFIPHIYKVSSRKNRLALLAGLIDTDGSLVHTGGYDYISKSVQLSKDVTFLARSLGYAAYCKSCKKCDQNGTEGTYYRVSITGNLEELPVLLSYKKSKIRLQKKDFLVTGFTVQPLPENNYYGFELDKDHLYLTADFTVHHNTGKSLIPAVFIERVLKIWPNQRFLIVTHVKELIQQNYEVLKIHWPEAPAGIYSAGLKQKDIAHSIIFGGVQSMIRNAMAFGHRDIIFIDEAHLVSPVDTTMYQRFLATMKLVNPRMKVIGLSATPFRMGQGLLTDGGLFTDIIHNLTSCDDFNKLIADGYLCPLVPRRTHTELDVSNVSVAGGEFVGNQLQAAVDVDKITFNALKETVAAGHNRKSWLIFASGIQHAEHIATCLNSFGINCAAVHSKCPTDYNDNAIKAFRVNKLRAISNYGKLTTGFNHPDIDLIVDLRPTMSIPLHIQKLGRGTRMANNKLNCISKGSLILTNKGLVPIEKVSLEMKLWDGVEFVSHSGVICNGKREVIYYEGLMATKNHNVWTEQGWKHFGDCAREHRRIAITGNGWKTIQKTKNYFTTDDDKRVWQKNNTALCFYSMSNLSKQGLERVLEFILLKSWMPKMWQQSCLASSADVVTKAMYFCKNEMCEQKRFALSRLWWSRNTISFQQSNSNGYLGNEKSWSTQRITDRSYSQRSALRNWKFKILDTYRKYEKSQTLPIQRKQRIFIRTVYDILNAGPRNRFTANNLLVHNCMVLDFARNVPRLGPINDPVIPKKKDGKPGDVPVKICDACGTYNHTRVRFCTSCGNEFQFQVKLVPKAGLVDIIKTDLPIYETFEVNNAYYAKRQKEGRPPYIRATYRCGILSFSENVFPEGQRYAKHLFHQWWLQRHPAPPPVTADEVLAYVSQLRYPKRIKVHVNKRYPEIVSSEY